jgi:hypothetical protein
VTIVIPVLEDIGSPRSVFLAQFNKALCLDFVGEKLRDSTATILRSKIPFAHGSLRPTKIPERLVKTGLLTTFPYSFSSGQLPMTLVSGIFSEMGR